jgi:hypothetical protein
MSAGTFYAWKAKYGGMTVSDAKRLKPLEDENAKLKELLAKKVGPAVKRTGVAHLRAKLGLSERRACRLVGADRKMIRYRSIRPPETALRQRPRDLANGRRRFGYPLPTGDWNNRREGRLFVPLRREGEPSGINRISRLYRRMEEDQKTVRGTVFPTTLAVRKRPARRKALGTRAANLVEARPNARPSRQPGVAMRLPGNGIIGSSPSPAVLGPMAHSLATARPNGASMSRSTISAPVAAPLGECMHSPAGNGFRILNVVDDVTRGRDPGMLGRDPRHLDLATACCPRVGRCDREAWTARHDRFGSSRWNAIAPNDTGEGNRPDQ